MKKILLWKRCYTLLFIFILSFSASVVNATDRYVNADGLCGGNSPCYTTIQAAINASSAADIIHVASGTYTEQLQISKSITIVGAGAATTTIQAPAVMVNDPDGAKTIVLFTGAITAEISGFTIQGPVNGLNFGIYVRDGATVNIHDNTVKDIRDEPLSGNQYGYGIEIGKYNNTFPFVNQIGHATITNNTVYGYQKNGIECEGAGSSATITGNTVTGAGPTPITAQNGIQIRRGATGSINTNVVTGNAYTGPDVNATGIIVTFPGNGVIIQGNTVNHNTANIYTYAADGVQILDNQVSDAAVGLTTGGITVFSDVPPLNGITISGNTVQNNLSGGSHQGDGIDLYGINSATVSGNVIAGSGWDGIWIGQSGNIAITNNQFSGNGLLVSDPNAAAIDLGNGAPNTLGGFAVHENSFVGNRYGIYNYDVASLNATCNWWGSITGPTHASNPGGTGDKVSDRVDFTPWLTNGSDDSPSPGFQPAPGSCLDSDNDGIPDQVDNCPTVANPDQVNSDNDTMGNACDPDDDNDNILDGDDCAPLDPAIGAKPKLSTTINGVTVNSNNDGTDDQASFGVCNTPNNITFGPFTDQNGNTGPSVKAYQIIQTTNVSVPFCNNCSAPLAVFNGTTGTASLVNPAMQGTLVMTFREFIDLDGDGQIDANECAGVDQIIYTVTVYPAPPTINCPGNITKNTDPGVCNAVVNYTVGTTNAATVTHSFSGATTGAGSGTGSGSSFNKGVTNVTVTATNPCGTASCQFSITVEDHENPTITCPPNQTVNPTSLSGATVTYTAPVGTDNCPGATTTKTAGPASGSTFPIGTTTVTYKVTDASGNIATCSFTVTVRDPSCDSKGKKSYVCHNGNTLCVGDAAVPAHLAHGDQLGQCSWYSAGRMVTVEEKAPEAYKVMNFPNPFSTETTIRFELPADSRVSIIVYDMMGKQVANVLSAERKAGVYYEGFSASNLPSGTYYYKFIALNKGKEFIQTEKLSIIR